MVKPLPVGKIEFLREKPPLRRKPRKPRKPKT